MIRADRHSWAGATGLLALPAALIVVCLAAGTSSAQPAHCGFYVDRIGDAALREALGLDSLAEGRAVDDRAEPAGRPLPGDRPCDGPSCSRGSDPRPAAPSSSPPPPDHWACLGPDSSPAEPPRHPLTETDRLLRPDPIPIGIFHPPRVG